LVIHYTEYGNKSAPLMVFIHGGGVSGWMWDQQIRYFVNYHCLVPDLPEHGGSRGSLFSINESAIQLAELIAEKGKGKTVIVIGFSLGAQVLIAMLSKIPDVIDYAMINSALVKPISYKKLLLRSIIWTHPLIKIKAFSKIQAKSMYIDDNYFEIYYQESCGISKEAFVRVLDENLSFSIPQNFKNVSSRILVTVGEKERGMMKKSYEDLVNSNSNCKGVIFPNVGHGISLAEPEYFNEFVKNWLSDEEDWRMPREKRLSAAEINSIV